MREIKFRAWDINNNQMLDWNTLTQSVWNNNSAQLLYSVMVLLKPNYVLQLFTGLHDKNGKKIYEGDIFCVASNNEYQVRYCNGGESNYKWYGGCFILWLNDETFFPFDEYAIKNGKVIGNIYENPELLK